MGNQKGITLIEILSVLAIVSILSAVAYPPVKSWYQEAEFRSEVCTLVSWLHRAKSEAVKTDSAVVVDVEKNGYTIFVDNSTAPKKADDWIREKDERLLADYRVRDGLTLDSTFTKDRFRFNNTPGMKAGTFKLRDLAGHHMDVVISILGRIRVK